MISLCQCPPGYLIESRDGISPEPKREAIVALLAMAQPTGMGGDVNIAIIPMVFREGQGFVAVHSGKLVRSDV